MSDIADRVKKIVVEHLGVEADKVTDNANFIDDLGADSLDTVELVMAFEEEFNVEIPDDAAEAIVTVGDAIKFIEKSAACISPPGWCSALGKGLWGSACDVSSLPGWGWCRRSVAGSSRTGAGSLRVRGGP